MNVKKPIKVISITVGIVVVLLVLVYIALYYDAIVLCPRRLVEMDKVVDPKVVQDLYEQGTLTEPPSHFVNCEDSLDSFRNFFKLF